MIVSIKQWFGIIVLGWYENEDLRPPYENEDPLRKRRSPTKTKTHYENEDPTKTKTHYENEDTLLKQVQKRLVLPLWTKIMFMRHTTKTKILTEILNSEFGTSVIYYGAFNETTLKLKRDLKEETWHAYGDALRDALSAGGKDNI